MVYRILLGSVGVSFLSISLYWSVRLVYADHQARAHPPEGVLRAIQLVPGNELYRLMAAGQLDERGEDDTSALEGALAVNPNDASAWIQLGLRAERFQELARAERCLLAAASASRQYEPRWTLVNFYFRHDNPEAFWRWAPEAVRISYGDRRPLFQLFWRVSQNPEQILRAFPDEPNGGRQLAEAQRDYLRFLLGEKKLDAAQALAARIRSRPQPDDAPALLDFCNAMLDAKLAGPALETWNVLCARKLIPYQPLGPQRGASLTNGNFRPDSPAAGFDWRVNSLPGVSIVRTGSYLRATFSGKQPEACEILWQYVPLEPGRRYELQFDYQTRDARPRSGLRWKVMGGNGQVSAESADLASDDWKHETFGFTADASLVRLVLWYQRMPGATRIEGSISLRSAALGFRP